MKGKRPLKAAKTTGKRPPKPSSRLMAKVDLTTTVRGLHFKNPVTVASGTFGTKDEYADCVRYENLGAIITKTITVNPRPGNAMPRICETAGGMLNAIGLQNKGLEDFLENKIPFFSGIKTPLIVNIAGESFADFETLAKSLNAHKNVVKALEVNLSCPNVEAGGVSFMKKKERITDVIKAVRDSTPMPVFAKLSPELGDILEIAGLLIREGVDGLSLINTLKGMAVNVETRRPRLANGTGGLSGPAIKPVALRYVYDIKRHFGIPVIASGGVMSAMDALEYLIVGADLIAIGTANFVNPSATEEVIRGIYEYCQRHHIVHVEHLRGSLEFGS